MPILNFQRQFKEAVMSGVKTQTIRAKRKFPIEKGDPLFLYVGLRTKKTEKIGEVVCLSSEEIEIKRHEVVWCGGFFWINDAKDLNKFAQDDGFRNWNDMIEWFKKTHGLPFKGNLIKW